MTSDTSVSTESRARKCRAASAGSAAAYSATAEKVGAGERAGVMATSCEYGSRTPKEHYGWLVEMASPRLRPHPAQVREEGRGRNRAAQEFLDYLAGGPLQSPTVEAGRHPGIPAEVALGEFTVARPGARPDRGDHDGAGGVVHHVTGLVHQLAPHGPPGEVGVCADVEV